MFVIRESRGGLSVLNDYKFEYVAHKLQKERLSEECLEIKVQASPDQRDHGLSTRKLHLLMLTVKYIKALWPLRHAYVVKCFHMTVNPYLFLHLI